MEPVKKCEAGDVNQPPVLIQQMLTHMANTESSAANSRQESDRFTL
jgi:hypothetical protein